MLIHRYRPLSGSRGLYQDTPWTAIHTHMNMESACPPIMHVFGPGVLGERADPTQKDPREDKTLCCAVRHHRD